MKPHRLLISIATTLIATPSIASDDLFGPAEDGLFGDGTGFITNSIDNSENLADQMLINEAGIVWSGSYQWDTQFSAEDLAGLSEDADIETSFSGYLKLDARPDTDYRVLLNLDYDVGQDDANLNLREGFADFTIAESLFIRAGQQTITWGVGYFFSPADTLNSDRLDASNPDAERTGTAAVRIHMPINKSNIYAYALPDDQEDTMTLAAKGEWLIAGGEIGVGVSYDGNDTWNVMGTYTRPADFGDFFAEYNSGLGHSTVDVSSTGDISDRSEEWLHQATAGVIRTKDWGEFASATLTAQYFFNGKGYDHTLRTDNPMLWSQLDAQYSISALAGQHYGATSLRLDEVFGTKVSLSASRLLDISDTSQLLSANIVWSPIEMVAFEAGLSLFSGDKGSSYAPVGDQESYYLLVTLANGSF